MDDYTITWDVEKGSELREGVEDFNLTRATRRFKVEKTGSSNKLDGRAGLLYAVDYIKEWHTKTGNKFVHPLDPDVLIHPDYHNTAAISTRTGSGETGTDDLPLSYILVTYLRPGVVLGEAVYSRTAYSIPRFAAFDQANEEWYRAGKYVEYTYPSQTVRLVNHPIYGSFSGTNNLEGGIGWSPIEPYRDSVVSWNAEITVRTVIPEHPADTIVDNAGPAFAAASSAGGANYNLQTPDGLEDVMRIINSDEFYINGVKRAPGTLMFTGINIEPIQTAKKLKYLVEYTFDYNPNTFYKKIRQTLITYCEYVYPSDWYLTDNCTVSTQDSQIALYKTFTVKGTPISFGGPSGGFVYYPSYVSVEFAGLFPVHDAPDGYDGQKGNKKAGKWILSGPWNNPSA